MKKHLKRDMEDGNRKPSKRERKAMKQRRQVERVLGGNAKGFFASTN